MHIVTFYSFKGGVGRTMALINTAAELTARLKRVLVVDFDLEAPGIQTYEPFSNGAIQLGVVDYVTNYMQNRIAPVAADYVVQREIGEYPIWLMPAGAHDGAYGSRLNSIDWLALYKDFDGFLMFEDLKQQWKSMKFDYVLIDSRTGHTDVGGICTRQLPDAAVLMFFPNDQNLVGLEEVVRDIRGEAAGLRKKEIQLHFCPSNVPDIDDEEQILVRHLDDAMQRLHYKAPASIIHHYQALALLDQPIFVQRRPKTRLAEEYRRLVDDIVAGNLEDKAGAIARLDQIRTSIIENHGVSNLPDLEQILGRIYTNHLSDGDVAWSLSKVYGLTGDTEAQLDTLGIAIDSHVNEPRARSVRAALLLRRAGQTEQARDDLRKVVLARDVSVADFVSGIEELREIDPDWLHTVERAETLGTLSGKDRIRVVNRLMVERRGAELAVQMLANETDSGASNVRILGLIGTGDYEGAMNQLGDRSDILNSDTIEDVFNFACAEWGLMGKPSQDLFLRVAHLSIGQSRDGDPNYAQCMAMTFYVLGEHEKASELADRASKEVDQWPPIALFSSWRYLNVKRGDFKTDIEQMRAQIKMKSALVPGWRDPLLRMM